MAQVALAAAFAPLAAYDNGFYSDQECCEDDCSNWTLSAELLFLKYCRNDFTHLIGTLKPDGFARGEEFFLKHDFEPGFRFAACFSPSSCVNKILVEYTYFSTDKEVQIPGSGETGSGETGPPLVIDITGAIVDHGQTARVEDSIDLHVVDFIYQFFNTQNRCCESLSFSGGVRWLNQKEEFEYSRTVDDDDIYHETVPIENKINAVGLVMRLEAENRLPCNWGLRSKFAASALCGKNDILASFIERNLTASTGPEVIFEFVSDGAPRAIGSAEGSLRLVRDLQVGCFNGAISIGVEACRYFNIGGLNTGLSEEPEGSMLPIENGGNFNFFSRDVTLAGFSIGAAFCF
jgi:hypothetical protein